MQRKRGLEIGRPLGFPLLVHGSWFPAGLLLGAHLTISAYGGHDLLGAILLAVSTVLVFFVCVAAKELAQGAVARIVRAPFSDVTLYVFGGIPRSARESTNPISELIVALVGPGFAGAVGLLAVGGSSRFHGIPGNVCWTIGVANLALAVANLLPGIPLDGGRGVAAILSSRTGDRRRAEITAARAGQILGVVAFGGGVWFVLAGLSTVQDTAVGLWLIVGGILVAASATRSRRAALTLRKMNYSKAGEWARPFAGRVEVDGAVPGSGTYAVADRGRLAGVVAGRPTGSRVSDVMVPWTNDIAINSNDAISTAFGRLATKGVLVVVDDQGMVEGVLDRSCLREHL